MDQTFVMFKPDCIERGLLTKVMSRFEEKGLRLVALKMLRVTPDLAKQHYAEHVEKPFYPSLESFITAAPVVAAIYEGLDVVRVVREMLGATSGLKAAAGTIRGDFFALNFSPQAAQNSSVGDSKCSSRNRRCSFKLSGASDLSSS